ncbi:MAG: type II secretion system minor pseudopilin GspK [Betaproteobacteria bacterium]|nr:type II secretion system minor pseudopilin GspK [Betaproteobacteria bacterium]
MKRRTRLRAAHRGAWGAAILTALIVVAIAATIATTMLARQQAGIDAEEARRHAAQARWILRGALDWARLILREDARSTSVDHLGEAWAVPLKAIALKQFLAVGERADDAVYDAQLAGHIDDAQARFNLRNLVNDNQASDDDVQAFMRLLSALGEPDAKSIAAQALASVEGVTRGTLFSPLQATDLMPALTAEQRDRIAPYVAWLPRRTLVNANTASAEVLQAVVPGLQLSEAKTIVTRRASTFYRNPADFLQLIPGFKQTGVAPISTQSQYFIVTGQVLWGNLTVEERALVERNGLTVRIVSVEYGPTIPAKAES